MAEGEQGRFWGRTVEGKDRKKRDGPDRVGL